MLLGFAVVALLVGLSSQRRVARQAREGAAYANLKTGLLVEAVEGAETIKAGAGGWRFLSRWLDVSARTIANDLKMRHLSENVGYLGASLQQLSLIHIYRAPLKKTSAGAPGVEWGGVELWQMPGFGAK